jgi:crotonobetaine/carnitine-CoA ligase
MMAGYYKDPERTAEALRDGWLWTGDLAYRDDEGEFFFVDRKKDIVRRRGENISPAVVEAVLNSHPAVLEAAVIGVPSEFTDEEVVACVVLKDSAVSTAEELRAWCAERLASFKVPTDIRVLPTLPRTPTQKTQKEVLRAASLAGQEQGGRSWQRL